MQTITHEQMVKEIVNTLENNQSKQMTIGVHAGGFATYCTLNEWQVSADSFYIYIKNKENKQQFELLVNELEALEDDQELMQVYPDMGATLEVYLKGATVCFKFE
jgi:hypothetical protein